MLINAIVRDLGYGCIISRHDESIGERASEPTANTMQHHVLLGHSSASGRIAMQRLLPS
jgi:hypothetical protein